jgi:glycosyltransferase involved in cell wall biosynthesis
MERHLLALDVLVHPTYWEGMPIAVLEAMALGLPVIATAVNGVPEAIDDGRTGVLVAPGDVHGLVEAMLRLSGDSVLRRDLGAAARATARDRFSLERMLSEQAAVHDRAANAARRRRVPGPRRRTAPAEAP